jgi:hypothetical protein
MKTLCALTERNNLKSLDYIRATLAIASGAAAGILGLSSQYGFLFYLGTSAISSLVLLIKMKFDPFKYFTSTGFLNGILGNLSSFVLFWVLFYGIVYVYE